MKKLKLFIAAVLAATMVVSVAAVSAGADEAPAYDVTVAAENNLATNKWDWETDNVGSGSAVINENGMRFENFTLGSAIYAIYKTNKTNEFKFSMYANLNLTRPSESGLEHEFDYSNLYISFMINADSPSPSYTCPWNGSKAYFSICFENLQGHAKTNLYLNESWCGHGEERTVVAEAKGENEFNWNDGKYHWYEFEFTNETREIEYRDEMITTPGKLFKLYFDGEEKLSYFQQDKNVLAKSTGVISDVPFSTTSGYIGFWPSSDFPIGANTDTTNCFVDVKKVQITSYDNDNTTPYEICEAPDFDIESETFSPASSYDAGEEIEIRLSNLFSYEGDEELTYTVTCNGSSIGNITNGYWVWTPEEAGTYNVDFKAEAGEKSALNYVTLRVKAATLPPQPEPEKSGCNSSFGAPAILCVLAAAAAWCLIKRGKSEI